MTLTDTVSSIAHDAAQTATDLGKQAGKQAKVLGRSAAEAAAEAASNAATSAHHLVNSVGKKVPTVTVTTKKRKPWKLIVIVAIAGIGGVLFMKSKRSSTNVSTQDQQSATGPVAIRKTA